MRDFPEIDNRVELLPRDFAQTRTLMKKFVQKVYETERNIYINGSRVYIFQGKWKRKSVEILDEWARAVSRSFDEWLQRQKEKVRGLIHGEQKWARIEKLPRLRYYGQEKKRDPNVDARAILKEVSKGFRRRL
jgi:hypothetical protein